MIRKSLAPIAALTCALGVSLAQTAAANGEVNVYSYRQPFLVQPLFDAFTAESGIKVNVVFAKEGLVERLKSEGANSPADLVFTVDIGRLNDVVSAELAQATSNPILEANIPAHFRHPEGLWYGLTQRARIVVVSKERVEDGAIRDYEDLADPQWKGRICSRSGKHVYSVALTASMIAHHGRDGAKQWLQGVKDNLARRPQGNDRAQVKAIKEGLCDVAIINHYYLGVMLADPEQKPWAESVNLVFLNQGNRGNHVNISGMSLTTSAPNKDNAVKLMEFLSRDQAQQMYAEQNYEFPVKPGVEKPELIESWGEFKVDELPLVRVAELRSEAIKLTDEVGFDD